MVVDSEVVMLIWAIDSWEAWARVQLALDGDPEVARWRDRYAEHVPTGVASSSSTPRSIR